MKISKLAFLGVCSWLATSHSSLGQTCTSNPTTVSSNANFSALSWTGAGGVTNATCAAIAAGTNTTTTATFVVDLANAVTLTMDKDIKINGTFTLTNQGNSTLNVATGSDVWVTGNMGDASNNNVTFIIDGTLRVDGTLSGKNSNGFSGSGSYTGSLDFNQAPTGGAGITWTVPSGGCQPSGSTFCTTTVPITLVSFDAAVNEQKVELKWSTASEQNFDYFSLQRSNDGKTFGEIAQVKGHGTTNEQHSYSFDDTDPFIGRSYYRLTSNDFDGYQETFKVVSVQYHGGKKFHISPNPSDGTTIKLHFNFENDADAQVTIFDNVGSSIGTYQVPSAGSINFDNTLRSGVYLAKYASSTFTKTERFLVK